MSKGAYTTRLQAGLGLVAETIQLLEMWQPGQGGPDLLREALSSGRFPNVTARRLTNVVTEGFAPRYLVDDAAPARQLKPLMGNIASADVKQLFCIHTCRANRVLGDFIRHVFWARYAAGSPVVSKQDATEFVRRSVSDGLTTTRWSESTIVRVSSYLLGACVDFGLLGPMMQQARTIVLFRPSALVVSYLAHDLHFRGMGDNRVLQHEDWALFGFDPADVLDELKRFSLRGELIVQAAGSAVRIGWHADSMKEVTHGFVEG